MPDSILCTRRSALTLAAPFIPLSASLQTSALTRQHAEFDITNFGAAGDGTTLSTSAIQAAIDACCAAGGGRVAVPPGIFVTGTIRLKSNVTLYLHAGARLLGSTNASHYPKYAGLCDWHPKFPWGHQLNGTLPGLLVEIKAPSSAIATLNQQSAENRYVLHLLHYIPERRCTTFDVIEDVVPLADIAVRGRTSNPVKQVRAFPQGQSLEFR